MDRIWCQHTWPQTTCTYIKKCNLSCERLRNNKGESIWRRFNAEISESNRPKIWNTNVDARWLRSGTIIIETECDIPNNRKAKPNHLTPLQTWELVAGGKLCTWSETTVGKYHAQGRRSSTNREEPKRAEDLRTTLIQDANTLMRTMACSSMKSFVVASMNPNWHGSRQAKKDRCLVPELKTMLPGTACKIY